MIWWLSDPDRALEEISAIGKLEESADWLRNVSKRIDGADLVFDFEIVHGASRWRLNLRYPPFFPSIPPQVFNSDQKRLSGHQYGPDGELCLEFRPDNWARSITGAMMIESAWRLLSGESPEGDQRAVESAHSVTEGQSLRGVVWRFVLSESQRSMLNDMEDWQQLPVEVAEHLYAKVGIAHLISIGGEEDRLWERSKPVSKSKVYKGLAIRVPDELATAGSIDRPYLDLILTSQGIDPPSLRDPTTSLFLIVEADQLSLAMVMVDGDEERFYSYETITTPEAEIRLPEENLFLTERRIGVVGCGSVGSKIASMVVRSGCRRLNLYDADVLLPGNLVRNELDWRGVGAHKVGALKARLLEIDPSADIKERIVQLGGQESSGWTGAALESLAECDLIVDTTADPIVFGLSAAAARHGNKPMVWAEVFAGGIGGLIARARPGHDPAPDIARQQILAWCEEQGVPWAPSTVAIDYGVSREDQAPLIADDADVTTIAGHAARLAIDTLMKGSRFPHPAYVIGLSEGWLFTQPFDVRPISYTGSDDWGDFEAPDPESWKKLAAILFPPDETDDAR